MKFALIGQDIPMHLPAMLADLLFAGREAAEIAVEEKNYAMRDVLERYARAVIRQSGLGASFAASGDRAEVLAGADCVIYAGDLMASFRFRQDREALSGNNPEDPLGLTDQARVNGGIGGLLHTLRQGEAVLNLCDAMDENCPGALVISLGQPVARTVSMLLRRGYRAYGLAPSAERGPGGLDAVCKRLGLEAAKAGAVMCGLPGFSFLLSLTEKETRFDATRKLRELSRSGELGRLNRRWLDWYDAVAVGDPAAHAELLPAEPDFIPEAEPVFGESVERRKERIVYMNKVGDEGAAAGEGAMAQLLLLSRASALRPVRLALALMRGEDLEMRGVTRRNDGELPQLPAEAVIESCLTLASGALQPHGWRMPEALAEVCRTIDETNRLAARAAAGDRTALRECVETDPALEGLDRLYVQDVVDRMIRLHEDIITRL